MIRESIAILLVCAIMLATFIRSKNFGYALAVVPVGGIPLLHILAAAAIHFFPNGVFGARPAVAMAFVDVIALAATCVVIVRIALRIQSKKNRRIYNCLMLGFTILLGWVYILNSLRALLG